MKTKVLHTIENHKLLQRGAHIVLGLSGGPDSMCLFHVLLELAQELELTLHPVHVNHKFRPGAAEEDQKFVESVCKKEGLKCRTFVYDCPAIARAEGLTSEEAGRRVRYEAFGIVAAEIAATGVLPDQIAIAVAQNANDQCETILFRIMRGTGIDGLSGIAYRRYDQNGFAVIRPLLDVDRQAIEEYCRVHNLEPRIDHTNQETDYTRNKIRLELIPYLQESFNPNLIETINRLGSLAAADRDYIGEQVAAAYETALTGDRCRDHHSESDKIALSLDKIALSIEKLKELQPTIRARVYNRALSDIGLTENLTAAHLHGIDKAVLSESPSAAWDLPAGYRAERAYEYIIFRQDSTTHKHPITSTRHKHPITSTRDATNQTVTIEEAGDRVFIRLEGGEGREADSFCAAFAKEPLEAVYGRGAAHVIELRTRQPGDYMVILIDGQPHRKKLQDILVDMKVPKGDRDRLQLAAIGSEILWILPWPHFKTPSLRQKGRFSANYRCR